MNLLVCQYQATQFHDGNHIFSPWFDVGCICECVINMKKNGRKVWNSFTVFSWDLSYGNVHLFSSESDGFTAINRIGLEVIFTHSFSYALSLSLSLSLEKKCHRYVTYTHTINAAGSCKKIFASSGTTVIEHGKAWWWQEQAEKHTQWTRLKKT